MEQQCQNTVQEPARQIFPEIKGKLAEQAHTLTNVKISTTTFSDILDRHQGSVWVLQGPLGNSKDITYPHKTSWANAIADVANAVDKTRQMDLNLQSVHMGHFREIKAA